MKNAKRTTYVTTRNYTALAAWNRNGGSHGGTAKQKNRRDRKAAKQSLKFEA